jgi:cadmium resistance protein CadD (predicted permease)
LRLISRYHTLSPSSCLFCVALIGLAIASLYLRIPTIGTTLVKFRTWFFGAAYVVLGLGIVLKSL